MSQYLSHIPSIAESTEILLIAMRRDKHADAQKVQVMTDQHLLALAKIADYAKHLDELNDSQQE
jgi:hypothetical protein